MSALSILGAFLTCISGGIAHPGVYTSYDYVDGIFFSFSCSLSYTGFSYSRRSDSPREVLRNQASSQFPLSVSCVAHVSPPEHWIEPGSIHWEFCIEDDASLGCCRKVDRILCCEVRTPDLIQYTKLDKCSRQTNASTDAVQTYKITVPTSIGNLTLPTLGGELTLSGKDSKIHVVDYQAGNTTLLYSTGEIMTW